MSRHNRRRTRTSHRNSHLPIHYADLGVSAVEATMDQPDSKQPSISGPIRRRSTRDDLSAQHWHNRYMAWQIRQPQQQEERDTLVAEQRRIFGGENGEDDEDGLCSSMMEYFSGLDFIMEANARKE